MTPLFRTAGLLLVAATAPLLAAEAQADSGHTAWMIVATALVVFMTLPGLALFYGGLVRSKNVLSVLVQCFALAAIMSVVWVVVGYSLAFTGDGEHNNGVIGGLSLALLNGITPKSVTEDGGIPTILWVAFQMTFFIITPALIVGGIAERVKFVPLMLFSVAWGLLSYIPVCHMAWTEGGLFKSWGVLDFAGGTVVHINAGIAALAAALILGPRKGYNEEPMKPHNLTMTVTGAALLWVGWFGFNAGSEVAANGTAAMAMMVTHISAACGALGWMAVEMLTHRRASALGIVSGAVAGLVGITPAAGTVGIPGALVIGSLCGIGCWVGAVWLKQKMRWDDSLDAFGVHGVGGVIGAVLTGVFAAPLMGGWEDSVTERGIGAQVGWQSASVLVTIAWSGVVSVVLLLILKATTGLRVKPEEEEMGLDITSHNEEGYII